MKKVVVLGAGYAGLKTVVSLQQKLKDNIQIILVDRNNYHYETINLHEVAAGLQRSSRISYPISAVIKSNITTFIQDEVVSVDVDNKKIKLAKRKEPLYYDYCVIGLGFVAESFGISGVKENAFAMTNINEAEAIYKHLIARVKNYRQTKNDDDLRIIICGGGFTGIELAGALVDARVSLAELAGVSPNEIKIIIIEAANRLLPMFGKKLANYGVNLVKKLGVQLSTGSRILRIKPGQVYYKSSSNDKVQVKTAGTIIWTAGISGNPIMGEYGFKEQQGRVMVTDHLTAPGDDDVYILGDGAAVMPPAGNRPYPANAQLALAMANFTAVDIASRIKTGRHEARKFTYRSLGMVASVGNTHGFGNIMGQEVKGYFASAMKKVIADRSLMETGGIKELLFKGRFDLYH